MNKYYFKCTDCGKEFHNEKFMYLCPVCSADQNPNDPPKGVLHTYYDYDSISKDSKKLIANQWLDVLPISGSGYPYLKVGNNPLYKVKTEEHSLYIKDDSQNPTFSFKDRASILVSAYAKENNIDTIVAASTGNAGSSLAGICAANKQKAIILAPANAPQAKLAQIMFYGATLIPIDGTYDDAFDMSIALTVKHGYFNRNTGFNPFTIEGKKSVSFELYEQLGFKSPDRVFVPAGDGVISSGVYKGFEDLLLLGLIEKIPEVIVVQSEGSSHIADNFGKGSFHLTPSSTIADSISVDIPRNFNMICNFMNKYEGQTIKVSDKEITEAIAFSAKEYGIFPEPAAAASMAGYRKMLAENQIDNGSFNVILSTGSGLKDPMAAKAELDYPAPVKPNIDLVMKRI
jgi:threonine synthase